MTAPVATLDPTDSLAFAEELMTVERVRHLPVVDGDVLVGLVSHRDLMAATISTLDRRSSEEDDLDRKRRVQVREIMRGSLETVTEEDDATKAADVLLVQKIGCVPVVDERYHLTGIVTESDFVRMARERWLAAGAQPLGAVLSREPDAAAGAKSRRTRPPAPK